MSLKRSDSYGYIILLQGIKKDSVWSFLVYFPPRAKEKLAIM